MLGLIVSVVKIALCLWGLALAIVYGTPVAKALAEKYKTTARMVREAEINGKIEDAILYAEEWGRKFAKKGQDKFDKAVAHATGELADLCSDVEEIRDRVVSRLALMRADMGGALASLGKKIAGD